MKGATIGLILAGIIGLGRILWILIVEPTKEPK